MSEDQILDTLFKRLYIDDVENVKPEDVIFEEQGGKLIVSINYEVRRPTIGNIDLVASFYEEVEIDL
jgi:ribosomal protein S8